MDSTHAVNELIEQIVALEHARDALDDRLQRRNVARVIRQLRARLGVGVPKRRAATALGISPQALERWVQAGKLPAVRRPGSSREQIDARALLALVREVKRLRDRGQERPVSTALAALEGDPRLRRHLYPNPSARELRYEFLNSSPEDRLRAAVALSQTLHELATQCGEAPMTVEPPASPPGPHTPPDFFGLLRVLGDYGVEFVIIGGFAVGLHGFVRATKDVDIVPDPDASNMSRLWDAIGSIDARPAEWDDFTPDELPIPFTPDGLIESGGNGLLYTTLGRLDVTSYVEDDAGEIAYDELRAGAECREIDEIGQPVWFAGAQHMIAMKEHAGRDVDLTDVTALRMAHGIEDDPPGSS